MPIGTTANLDGTDGNLPRIFALNTGRANVTEDTVTGLATVFSCVTLIGKSIAQFPWEVLHAPDEKTTNKAKSHPVYNLLHEQPHPLYTSETFRRVMMTHLLLWGNFYAEIQRDNKNRPIALKIINPWDVQVFADADRLYYQIIKTGRLLQDYEIIHLKNFTTDGLIGRSPVRVARDTFQMSMDTQNFGTSFYQNGTRLSGAMTTEQKVSPDSKKLMRDDWESQYGAGARNQGKTAFLSDGWKYQQIGIPPGDAQFIETRKFSRTEICGIFHVPPHMVMDLENATFSNIENQNRWYVSHTLTPYIVSIEQEFNRKLFRDSEKGEYYNKLNVKGLLRGDTAAQTAHISALVDRGIYSRNEARAYDDLNPYDGGDDFLVQGAMTPADLLRGFYESKLNAGEPLDTNPPQS